MAKRKALPEASKVSSSKPRISPTADAQIVPHLASLFSNSLGPTAKPDSQPQERAASSSRRKSSYNVPSSKASSGHETRPLIQEIGEPESVGSAVSPIMASSTGYQSDDNATQPSKGKRLDEESRASRKSKKRKDREEEAEDRYVKKVFRQEHEDERLGAAQDVPNTRADPSLSPNAEIGEDEPPKHETVSETPSYDMDKAARTVFLGNVSSTAIESKSAKKILMNHLASHLPTLESGEVDPQHKIESIRFRSTAYATTLPKRAAFAKRDLMAATTLSTNAYVVYGTALAARLATKKLNGTVVLDRHLRVDSVAHPAKVDSRRCVFVGNLGFVDDESVVKESADGSTEKQKKQKQPSDVEEGLWRTFAKTGTVESVRVVRDSKTRVGKGIAYVQFSDENAVEAALLYNEKKFPPLLPRKLRVVRAKGIKRNESKRASNRLANPGVYAPRSSSDRNSMQGRAGKLFGKAGAAKLSKRSDTDKVGPSTTSAIKPPEAFIFEGYRAKSGQKPKLKMKKGKVGKPQNRSSRRGTAWKASRKDKGASK